MSDSVDPDEGTVNPFAPKADEAKAEPKPRASRGKATTTSKALAAVKDVPSDEADAPQREAEDEIETITLDFHGQKFTLPADQEDWPILATQAFSKGLAIDGIELILGRVQWARFVAKFPRKRQFTEFSDLIAEEFGFGSAGN